MSKLVRFGISLEKGLLDKFDSVIKKKNCPNRSEAFRDLIRKELVSEEWQRQGEIAGAITLVYNHHKRDLLNKLADIEHDFQKVIISNQHIHLDHDNCLEIVAVKGSPQKVQKLADMVKSVKGVKCATLSMASTGKNLE
ncbi:MAG: nickel-responsive transcriptional regulator NikR [Candidatus Saelkia tenebricola]|nr:nickel-responsive transcriptional regulator NikR [Candidatus Saelkia tenebricola]